VLLVFGFDNGQGEVLGVVQKVVGALLLAPGDEFATHDDPAGGEGDFASDLASEVPAGGPDRRGDTGHADFGLVERHAGILSEPPNDLLQIKYRVGTTSSDYGRV
jgi:hypothetical protein